MAKSSFWDDLGNTLTRKEKGLSSRAENLYEIQKIRNKLSAQERMTEKLMMDIGKMIYTRYEQGGCICNICYEIQDEKTADEHGSYPESVSWYAGNDCSLLHTEIF